MTDVLTLSTDPLLIAAQAIELDSNEVRRILWAIVAPATRDDLPEVLGKLARMLVAADDEWPGVLEALKMATWPTMISKLQPIAETLKYPTTPIGARHLGKRGGDSGHRQRNALYSALLALPDDGSKYASACDLLMAHVFLAHFHVLTIPAGTTLRGGLVKGDTSISAYEAYSDQAPWPALTISPKHCCLALRGLFCGEDWACDVIADFPVVEPPEDLAVYNGLAFDNPRLPKDKSKEWLDDLQGAILRYLAQAYGKQSRHRGHGKKPKPQGSLSGSSEEDDSKTEAAYRHDVCPDEDEGDDEGYDDLGADAGRSGRSVRTGNPGAKHPGNRTAKKTKKLSKGTGNAAGAGSDQAIKGSKIFSFATDRLSPSVLAVIDIDRRRRAEEILAKLMSVVNASEPSDDADLAEQDLKAEVELLLYVLVMLWTNSDIDRVHGLRIYQVEECRDQIPLAILFPPGSEGTSAKVRIHITFPKDAPRREQLPPYDRDRTEFVLLPDEAELGPLLWRYLAVTDRALQAPMQLNVMEAFRQPVGYYCEQIPRLLEQLSPGGLSSVPLASALYDEIMNWSHKDISAATMITGELNLKARVQMFYAVRRMESLQEIYKGTVRYMRRAISLARPIDSCGEPKSNGLSSLLQLKRQTPPQTPFVPAPKTAKYIGINACPTDSAMQNAVLNLISKVEDVWAKSPSTNWVEAHNLYTYYVVWFFGFVTSARPTMRPILRVKDINEATMSGRLQDKGADKAKLVWLTDDLLVQLKLYEAYIDSTRLATRTEYPCWFFNDAEAPVPASEEICEQILHRYLPGFPTNIHRRWMFNALLDSGCPYVPDWAGHFLTGNRLVGRGATASPNIVGQTILQYLRPIISYLGFRPIQVRL